MSVGPSVLSITTGNPSLIIVSINQCEKKTSSKVDSIWHISTASWRTALAHKKLEQIKTKSECLKAKARAKNHTSTKEWQTNL